MKSIAPGSDKKWLTYSRLYIQALNAYISGNMDQLFFSLYVISVLSLIMQKKIKTKKDKFAPRKIRRHN